MSDESTHASLDCSLFTGPVPADVLAAVQSIEAQAFDSQYCTAATLLQTCGRRLIVARRGADAIVGYLLYAQTSLAVQVEKVAVPSAFKRQGVGSAMMSCLAHSAGRRVIRLHVEKTNVAALALYKNARFTSTATRSDYYGPGEDAFVMEKEVTDQH